MTGCHTAAGWKSNIIDIAPLVASGRIEILMKNCTPTRMKRATGNDLCDAVPQVLRLFEFHQARYQGCADVGDECCQICGSAWIQDESTCADDADLDDVVQAPWVLPHKCLVCNVAYHKCCSSDMLNKALVNSSLSLFTSIADAKPFIASSVFTDNPFDRASHALKAVRDFVGGYSIQDQMCSLCLFACSETEHIIREAEVLMPLQEAHD